MHSGWQITECWLNNSIMVRGHIHVTFPTTSNSTALEWNDRTTHNLLNNLYGCCMIIYGKIRKLDIKLHYGMCSTGSFYSASRAS